MFAHNAAVQSSHPYEAATMLAKEVVFPKDEVRWLLIDLDEKCVTCQGEDRLLIVDCDGAVVHCFSGTRADGCWPVDPLPLLLHIKH